MWFKRDVHLVIAYQAGVASGGVLSNYGYAITYKAHTPFLEFDLLDLSTVYFVIRGLFTHSLTCKIGFLLDTPPHGGLHRRRTRPVPSHRTSSTHVPCLLPPFSNARATPRCRKTHHQNAIRYMQTHLEAASFSHVPTIFRVPPSSNS